MYYKYYQSNYTFAVSVSVEINAICFWVSLYNAIMSLIDQCSNNTLGKTVNNNYIFMYTYIWEIIILKK